MAWQLRAEHQALWTPFLPKAERTGQTQRPDDAGLKRLAAVEDRRMKESKKSCLIFSDRYKKIQKRLVRERIDARQGCLERDSD